MARDKVDNFGISMVTANLSGWGPAKELIKQTKASIVLVQETKLPAGDAIAEASQWASKMDGTAYGALPAQEKEEDGHQGWPFSRAVPWACERFREEVRSAEREQLQGSLRRARATHQS